MHVAQRYINTIYSSPPLPASPLTTAQAASLESALVQDAMSYTYSGIISLTEAIYGVDHNAFSWATVKAYYSTFYFLRALLATKKICLFYSGSKPLVVISRTGEIPIKAKGNTHEVILSQFNSHAKAHWLLSQEISGENPLNWLRHLREEANYTRSRFIEPNVPIQFSRLKEIGARRAIGRYLVDDTFAFDADHAIIAYPLQVLIFLMTDIKGVGAKFNNDDRKFLASLCKDKDGPIPAFNALFN